MRHLIYALLALMLSVSAQAQASAGFTKIGNTSGLTFTDTSCQNLTTCFYQVTVLDAQGFESAPSTCAATVPCVGGNAAMAIMPSSGTHTVTLTWTASTTTGVTYNVYRHVGPIAASGLNAVVN